MASIPPPNRPNPPPDRPKKLPPNKDPMTGWVEPRPEQVTPIDFDQVKRRLDAAETQLQSTRLFAGVIASGSLVVAVVAALVSATRPSQATDDGAGIKAPFRVVDDQGRVLLNVSSEENGPQLRLFDSSHRVVAWMGAAEEGGNVSVVGRTGSTASLGAGGAGGHLTVSDGKARPAAWLGVRDEGAQLTCWTRSGRDVLTLAAKERGGSLLLSNQMGITRALTFAGASSGRLVIADGTGGLFGLPYAGGQIESSAARPPQGLTRPGEAPRGRSASAPAAQGGAGQPAAGALPKMAKAQPPVKAAAPSTISPRTGTARPAGVTPRGASQSRAVWRRHKRWCRKTHRRGRYLAGGHWHYRWVRNSRLMAQRPGSASQVAAARQQAALRLQVRVASRLMDVARDYRRLKSPVQADIFYGRALSTYRQALGQNHRLVALALQELGGFYRGCGRSAEAERMYRQALAAFEKSLGPIHGRIAACLTGLGSLYRSQGKFAEAEPLYRRAVDCYEKVLGPAAPEVAATRRTCTAVQQRLGTPRSTRRGQQAAGTPQASPKSAGSAAQQPGASAPPASGETAPPKLKEGQTEY